MHKNATKCYETLSKWYKNKHGASKIMDTLETYHSLVTVSCRCCCKVLFVGKGFFEYTSMAVNIVNALCKRHDQLAQEQHDEIVRQLEAGELSGGKGKPIN
jgi:hypothetical protein